MTVKEIGQGTLTFGAWVLACRVALTPATLALTTPGDVLDPVTAVVVLVAVVEELVEVVVLAVLALDLPDPPQALSAVLASVAASSAIRARCVVQWPRA